MIYSARGQLWNEMTIKGTDGYFCGLRIDRDTIPTQFNVYELAGDSNPCRYANSILNDFFGTFITTQKLDPEYNGADMMDGDCSYAIHEGIRFNELVKAENVADKLFTKLNGGNNNDLCIKNMQPN